MDYKRIVIHPKGTENKKAIQEMVVAFDGIFQEKRLLGMLTYEAKFVDFGKAQACKQYLDEMKEVVSYTTWIEQS